MTQEYFGSFREGGPVNIVALLMHPDEITQVIQSKVLTWDLNIFDDDSSTPGVPVWALTGISAASGFQASKQTGKYQTIAPNGYTFQKNIGHDEADTNGVLWNAINVGGRRYIFEVVVVSTDQELDNTSWRWLGSCDSRISGTAT